MADLTGVARSRPRLALVVLVLTLMLVGLGAVAAPAAARVPGTATPASPLTAGVRAAAPSPNPVEGVLHAVTNPTVAYVLLSLGLLGIVLELAGPGAILPGVLGSICLVLALYAFGRLDVDWAGVGLIGLAFLLFLLDLYVPSHGALTLGGLVAFGAGSLILHGSAGSPPVQVSGIVIGVTTAVLGALFLFVVGAVVKARLRPARTGREALVGAAGTVRRALDPEGFVFVEGELWRASSPLAPIAVGTPVRVIAVEGLHLSVLPTDSLQPEPLDSTLTGD